MQLNSELKFPDGSGFYPDVQNGIRGYNTDPERGADTFSPFSDIAMPFTSAFFLGAANFATSYQYVYAELKIPVGKSSKTFTATCSGNSMIIDLYFLSLDLTGKRKAYILVVALKLWFLIFLHQNMLS